MTENEDKAQEQQEKPESGKYSEIEKRKKMLTDETKKVVGGGQPPGPVREGER